jgi:hypothetical protein
VFRGRSTAKDCFVLDGGTVPRLLSEVAGPSARFGPFFRVGGDRDVLGAIPFDLAQLREELRNGKTVTELTAWSPPTQ